MPSQKAIYQQMLEDGTKQEAKSEKSSNDGMTPAVFLYEALKIAGSQYISLAIHFSMFMH